MHRLADPCATGTNKKRASGIAPHGYFDRWRPAIAQVMLAVMLFPLETAAHTITVNFAADRPLDLAQGEAPRSNCSLREAINNTDNKSSLANNGCAAGSGNDIIEFAPEISEVRLDAGQFGVLSINSNAALEIRGHSYTDKVRINGQNLGPIFDVDNSDAYVQIENIEFRNGAREGAGGAILQKGGTLVLRACRFDRNSATSGGALAVSGTDARLTVYDCSFWGNLAEGLSNPSIPTGRGGAIWFSGASANIRQTAFGQNIAQDQGGAIDCDGSAGSMTIAGSSGAENDNIGVNLSFFVGNSTLAPNADMTGAGGGGAIRSECYLVVTTTRFEQNGSAGKGGGVYIPSGAVSAYFFRVAFENNKAVAASGFGLGGAAAVEGNATFNHVSASNNTANMGGAFLIRGINGTRYATLENTTLFGNTSLNGDGAAAYFAGPLSSGKVQLLHVTLDDNKGGADGNALYFDANLGGSVRIKNSIIQTKTSGSNCGGTVNSGTLDPAEGTTSIQFDNQSVDSCDNGVKVIPIRDAAFVTQGATGSAFPHLRFSSIDARSPASRQPGADPITCGIVGYARPPTWPQLAYGQDQMDRLRDETSCAMGAVQPMADLRF